MQIVPNNPVVNLAWALLVSHIKGLCWLSVTLMWLSCTVLALKACEGQKMLKSASDAPLGHEPLKALPRRMEALEP